jgi:geranylgeranyl reductase family protein
MKTVAVLGGGPAGAYAAERLAAAGLRTTLLDEKLAWEKPCGGGLTYKAYSRYPFLIDNDTPKRLVRNTTLQSATSGRADLELTRPLVIYSRYELNTLMLARAEKAGAQIEQTRVLSLRKSAGGWRIETKAGVLAADFCVVATGARNSIRSAGTEWGRGDTMTALGYYVPAEQPHVELQFVPGFEGYIWVFPRQDHLSVGICGKGWTAQAMRERLDRFLAHRSTSLKNATFYAHVLPSLERPSWATNRVSGENWLAVGDAAGLVDPVTGEGLYYAIRSADLAAQVLLADCPNAASRYREALRHDFADDLQIGARMGKRLYLGKFLGSDMPGQMIRFARHSATLRDIMQDLFAGTQEYAGLKPRLMRALNATLRDVAFSWCRQRLVPAPAQR